jgi:LmbE family N-acetylglucosaminyl deacetylase
VSHALAVVVAHPDDDTFGVTGTAALHEHDPAFELTAVLLTSGDAGEIADPSLATPETLGEVREAEDRASWAALGVVSARPGTSSCATATACSPRRIVRKPSRVSPTFFESSAPMSS